MKSHGGQRGAALILLLGIMAALAVFAASLVMVLANQQGATAAERSRKTSLYYAEGALDAAVSDHPRWQRHRRNHRRYQSGPDFDGFGHHRPDW